ncbi:hypothetical protein ACJMK2_041861 [Sinanodonta woodiana]|uniref:Organic solute transporter subunit alpha n=1 Tax=Sinanodonta woodiana TaxID=1069815 RepID=A0ABD3W5I5_SINWO
MVCSSEIPFTWEYYSEIKEDTTELVLLAITAVCTALVILIFLEEVVFLRRNVAQTKKKAKTICMLGLYPVVAVMAFVGVLVPRSITIVNLVAYSYVCVCIFVFLSLLLDYFGGDSGIIRELAEKKVALNTLPLCCCCICLPETILNRRSLKIFKIFAYQIIIIRPCILFATAVLWNNGMNTHKVDFASPIVYINILGGISTVASVYGIGIIARATLAHLPGRYIRPKFISLQLVIMLLGIQILLFNILAGRSLPPCSGTRDSYVRATILENEILTWEMLLLSLLARYGYRRVEEGAGNELVDSERGNKVINIYEKEVNVNDTKTF